MVDVVNINCCKVRPGVYGNETVSGASVKILWNRV